MRFCQTSRTKLSHAESRPAASQSRPARSTAQSSPSDEKIIRILEALSIAELSCAESAKLLISTKKSLGLSLISWAPDQDR